MTQKNLKKFPEENLCFQKKKILVFALLSKNRWHPGWGSTRSGAPKLAPYKYHPAMGVVHLFTENYPSQCQNQIRKKINVLGVIFDQKLQWTDRVAYCISKSSKALCAIRLISKFFNTTELLQLITSNFYSILYYNSEIWHLSSLKRDLKQKLLSSSAKAIKICAKFNTSEISFIEIHKMYKRATPDNFLLYKHALALYKNFWSNDLTMEFVALNFNSIIRQTHFVALSNNKRKVGLNALANRFRQLNNRIPFVQLNKSLESYKVFCKKEFIVF